MVKTEKPRKLTAFEKKCNIVSELTGVHVHFPGDIADSTDQFEDDGCLHIQKKGSPRACFSIGQDTDPREANEMTRKVMIGLGLGLKISDRVLVEEQDEDEDDGGYCSHCGRG